MVSVSVETSLSRARKIMPVAAAATAKSRINVSRSTIRRSFNHTREMGKPIYLFKQGKLPWQAILNVLPGDLERLIASVNTGQTSRLTGNRLNHKIHHRAHMPKPCHIGPCQQP